MSFRGRSAALLILLVTALVPARSHAERMEPLPKELEGVGVTEKLGALVPRDTPFRDETGRPVRFGDVELAGKPTLLTLNYSNCAMLCSLQLTALVKGLRGVDWAGGNQFQIITVSLDPNETPERARQTQQRYVGEYGKGTVEGWRFLTGPESSIRAVANAVGFGYRWDDSSKQFVHVPAIILLRPDGTVGRYLYGLDYPPSTLRLALREVADGKMVSAVDQLILFCFHYDANAGRYAPVASRIMRIGAALTLAFLAAALTILFARERKRKSETA